MLATMFALQPWSGLPFLVFPRPKNATQEHSPTFKVAAFVQSQLSVDLPGHVARHSAVEYNKRPSQPPPAPQRALLLFHPTKYSRPHVAASWPSS